jgi:hypothetical protein
MSAWDSVKKAIIGVAPILGGVLGGPGGAVAATTLSNVLLGKPNGSPEEILPIVTNPTHESYTKLKQAEIAFERICIELSAVDVLDARQKKADSEGKTGKRDPVMSFIAISVVSSVIAVVFCLMFFKIQPGVDRMVYFMLGSLQGGFLAILYFYFGSSFGSMKKTGIMANEQQNGVISSWINKLSDKM